MWLSKAAEIVENGIDETLSYTTCRRNADAA
jgi:hypothetical protein